MKIKLANLGRPSALRETVRSYYLHRIIERRMRQARPAVRAWCEAHAESVDAFARTLDPDLWTKAVEIGEALERKAGQVLSELGVALGGAGHYPLLYFLVKYRKPEYILETGVAAGYSTQAILLALAENGAGHLFSSDLPYPYLNNPENFVGCLVDENLKSRWTLFLEGDRSNLGKILSQAPFIDFVHYDSDKTYAGRHFFVRRIEDTLRPGAFFLMDDIQDNFFFRDYVEQKTCRFRVFEFGGKFVGLIGL